MRRSLFLFAAALFVSATAFAQSTLTLEGSSNVTNWKCESSTVDVSELGLRIPVKTIRCGNRQMERDLYRALRAESHPAIDFQFIDMDRGTARATIRGNLSLAGTTRTIEIDASVQPLTRDRVRMQARLPLRMTDFHITPPTALFGLVKAQNDLVVQFDLVLEAAP